MFEVTPKQIINPGDTLSFTIIPQPESLPKLYVDPALDDVLLNFYHQDDSYVVDFSGLRNHQRCNVGFFEIDGTHIPFRYQYTNGKYEFCVL